MGLYRKKPVVVEAEQYWPTKNIPGIQFEELSEGLEPYIETLEGRMRVNNGDWIVTGVKGEKYPVRQDIFAATYEPVETHP